MRGRLIGLAQVDTADEDVAERSCDDKDDEKYDDGYVQACLLVVQALQETIVLAHPVLRHGEVEGGRVGAGCEGDLHVHLE